MNVDVARQHLSRPVDAQHRHRLAAFKAKAEIVGRRDPVGEMEVTGDVRE
jgi:hypothetical protein